MLPILEDCSDLRLQNELSSEHMPNADGQKPQNRRSLKLTF